MADAYALIERHDAAVLAVVMHPNDFWRSEKVWNAAGIWDVGSTGVEGIGQKGVLWGAKVVTNNDANEGTILILGWRPAGPWQPPDRDLQWYRQEIKTSIH